MPWSGEGFGFGLYIEMYIHIVKFCKIARGVDGLRNHSGSDFSDSGSRWIFAQQVTWPSTSTFASTMKARRWSSGTAASARSGGRRRESSNASPSSRAETLR